MSVDWKIFRLATLLNTSQVIEGGLCQMFKLDVVGAVTAPFDIDASVLFLSLDHVNILVG